MDRRAKRLPSRCGSQIQICQALRRTWCLILGVWDGRKVAFVLRRAAIPSISWPRPAKLPRRYPGLELAVAEHCELLLDVENTKASRQLQGTELAVSLKSAIGRRRRR